MDLGVYSLEFGSTRVSQQDLIRALLARLERESPFGGAFSVYKISRL